MPATQHFPEVPKIAFLGPEGTYSHQAAYDHFGPLATYVPQETITKTFDCVSPAIPFGLIPLENSTHGAVVETYDLLRSTRWGQSAFIRGEVTLRIRHALVVRTGVGLDQIVRVLSHEQALGQCSKFLAKKLPNATLVATTSTAAAAQTVFSSPPSPDGESAAICATICVELYDGLEVLLRDIQDGQDTNLTRFLLLSSSSANPLPSSDPEPHAQRAFIRLSVPPYSKSFPTLEFLVGALTSSRTSSVSPLTIVRIDRRPTLNSPPWHETYFCEVEQLPSQESKKDNLEDDSLRLRKGKVRWRKQVEEAVENVRSQKGDAQVLGIW